MEAEGIAPVTAYQLIEEDGGGSAAVRPARATSDLDRCMGCRMSPRLAYCIDVLSRVVGALGFAYSIACSAVSGRGNDILDPLTGLALSLKDSCPGGFYWFVIALPCFGLAFRPLWIIVSQKYCPRGRTLYRFCTYKDRVKPFRCGCGCSWIFPFLCVLDMIFLTAGHFIVNSTTYGVTGNVTSGPERNEAPDAVIELTFWDTIQGNARSGNWANMFLAIAFNVAIPYFALTCMILSWFGKTGRGWLVTFVCLIIKWCNFHQYSATLNGISTAFEITIPAVLDDGLWLESTVGTGGLLTVAAILLAFILAEVLLWTYAHSPASDADSDEGPTTPWARETGPMAAGKQSRRILRRGSAARIGYDPQLSPSEGEPAVPLFRRIYERREKFRNLAEANQGTWSMPDPAYDEQIPACCGCCGTFDRTWFSSLPAVWAVQVLVPFCVVSFYICLYVGLAADVGLEYRFQTQIPCLCVALGNTCLLPLGCPAIVPANEACPAGGAPSPCGGGCFDRAEGVGGYRPDEEACIGGLYKTGIWELFADIWNAEAGFQHAPRLCGPGVDCYDGLPCQDVNEETGFGVCKKGIYLKITDHVFGFVLTIGPVVVIPVLQMLAVSVLWLVPMTVHRTAQWMLAAHMLMAISCLDVWVVTAAVRMPGMYSFSVASQQDVCDDFAVDPTFSVAIPDGVPDPCFGATGVLGTGFYWLIWPGMVQFWLTIYVSCDPFPPARCRPLLLATRSHCCRRCRGCTCRSSLTAARGGAQQL
jgi:hypothetical protein